MTDDGIHGEADLLVSIPRPRWRTIRRVIVFGSSLMISLLTLVVLCGGVYPRTMTVTQRAFLLGLLGVFCFNAVSKVVLLWLSLKLPLEILKSGIAFQGVKWSWEAIEGCRWARYSPDTLDVRFHRLRHYFPIPRNQRANVEAALRELDKWEC